MKRMCRTPTSISQLSVPEHNHTLLLVAVSFLTGCYSAPSLETGAWPWLVCLLALSLGFLLRRLGARASLALALCFFALGVARTHAALYVSTPAPGTYEITGYVSGGMRLRADNRISFTLADVALSGEQAPGTAYCSLHYDDVPPELFDGALVRFQGRAYLPDGKSGEPHMDFRLWMRQNGHSFGIVAYQGLSVENDPAAAPVMDAAYRIRHRFSQALTRVMGDKARVAMALLFGEREGLSEEERKGFETLGVAHVMSVSGLHVGLLGGLLLALLKRLGVRRRFRLPLLVVFLAAYCYLTGGTPASVRAAVMLLLSLCARLCLRSPDGITTLAAAMLAVLLLNPLDAMSAGFVLSFCAMLGITLYARPLSRRLLHLWPEPPPIGENRPGARRRRLRQRLHLGFFSLLSVSIAAQAGVLLPTAAYFHQLPLYGVAINLLVVPLVGTVLTPLYAITLALSGIPLLGSALGLVASGLTTFLLWLVELLATLPGAAVRVASPPLLFGIGLGAALVMLSHRVPGSLARRALAAALTLLIGLGGAYAKRPAELRYIQLAVGQADSALLLDGPATVLIDAGEDGQQALDYLLSEGRDVDALFITHLHMDHIGGVAALLDEGIQIHRVYLPVQAEQQRADPNAIAILDRLRAQNVPIHSLASGDELRYNETGVRVLWPVRGKTRSGRDANDMPLVLAIDFGGYTILSTSDLSGSYEIYAATPADVLKVAHHGSASSSGEAFLNYVDPCFALVSCTSASRVLPSAQTLERLWQSGAEVLRTDECGDITLSLRDGALQVTPYKAREAP